MKRIIFFDGVCPLCNRFVDFVIKRDHAHQFLFAAIQSEQARALLSNQDLQLDSVLLAEDKVIFSKSKAILRIFFTLGGWWTLVALVFAIFPASFRDIIYDWIARNRYRIFGKLNSCRLPTPEERKYFLQ